MVITCEQCQARFRLADEKLKPGGTKVRCSKCKHVFTVLPPEAPPLEEPVDYSDFNMERITDEEPPAPPEPQPAPVVTPPEPPARGEMDLDFSSLEQSAGPGAGELAETFSFADGASSAEPPATAAPTPEPMAGELDFDTAFAETEAPAAGPAEFAFDQELAQSGGMTAGEFDFAATAETEAPGEFGAPATSEPPGEFDFSADDASGELSEFGFETSAGEEPSPGGEATATPPAASFEFGSGDSFESSALAAESPFGEAGTSWEEPASEGGLSFDFDEPNFETKNQERVSKGREEAGLSFGEIDFSDDDRPETPNFGPEPDFSQASMAPAPETEPLPLPVSPPPQPAPARRPRAEGPLPLPVKPRKSPMARVMGLLALLLLILCGAGGYVYFKGNGRQVVDGLLLKLKGEAPPAPVEQRIGLNITGSNYVNNREAGQLLVVQGTVTNNFTTTRTAISVKGVLLDAAGKSIQQQTIFCGNYLDEEKLRTMRYAQIEEAMNNQFGDSLSNMNVSPGKVLRFTIVFRNVPKEMTNINVEVVDSKPGGN